MDASSLSRNGSGMNYMPSDYQLGDNDVICGRGMTCFNHIGNVKLRRLIQGRLPEYLNIKSKFDKSVLINAVVALVCLDGNFVKVDQKNGCYYEVGFHLSREKVSQGFRDALHEQYKSSSIKKGTKRKMLRLQKKKNLSSNANMELQCGSGTLNTPGETVKVVSPSHSELSVHNRAATDTTTDIDRDAADGNSTMNATFPEKNIYHWPQNIFLRHMKNDMDHNDASPPLVLIENDVRDTDDVRNTNKLISQVHKSFSNNDLPQDDRGELLIFLQSPEGQFFDSSNDVMASQRYPSLILDDGEELSLIADAWNDHYTPSHVIFSELTCPISKDKQYLFQTQSVTYDEDFMQLLTDLREQDL